MMFRYLGRFGVLAVCLFAIVIVMGGCGGDDDPPPDKPVEIVTPPVVELTPMEKLTGSYSLVESESVTANQVSLIISGRLHLRPGGNGWLATYEDEDGDSFGGSGPTWTANATTITFIDSGGETWTDDYTLEGKVLTLANLDTELDESAYIDKWRKD